MDESRIASCLATWREAGVRFTTAGAAVASGLVGQPSAPGAVRPPKDPAENEWLAALMAMTDEEKIALFT